MKTLEEYGANGKLQNVDGICPIDMSITEDIKDIKFHFMSLAKYGDFDFSGMGGNQLGQEAAEDQKKINKLRSER